MPRIGIRSKRGNHQENQGCSNIPKPHLPPSSNRLESGEWGKRKYGRGIRGGFRKAVKHKITTKRKHMNDNQQSAVFDVVLKYDPHRLTPEEKENCRIRAIKEEANKRVRRTDELRARWNAPKRHTYTDAIVWGGEWGAVKDSLVKRMERGNGVLVALIGRRGAGKTQLAVELMKGNTINQRSALYVSATEWFMTVKATYRKGSDLTEVDVIKQFRKPSLLIIDEFARRAESDWEHNLLFELLDKRYADMNSTIIISNQSKTELLDSLGRSLSSRLVETGGIVECNWPSWRGTEQ